jgi:hypothetical protein
MHHRSTARIAAGTIASQLRTTTARQKRNAVVLDARILIPQRPPGFARA